ncbi:nitrilase/cyanide hydratase and apolipoprotein N-acyltransferase [Formosa agariphila KMM 3901]|uniref:Omega-amidase YafV n=1 Tax=Formosa agariphila (strain DSM 15362 / KCTC 12365 / LMG 23005 / KMM 3901 / M-2Alg 35-1) TaxID=1347342 RepID=T2KQ62_FORAG|nr:amidohydrolase [Formosa agariphila]CDF80972.1 nitrilase/cyanide hydratase and apolipoprotein N-acyltransferase [Formosa agariphila KMM 3901]
MNDHLQIALIQTDLIWENPKANRENIQALVLSIPDAIDVVVLPEMFTTGFTMNAEKHAETLSGESVSWMKQLAHKKQAALMGSLILKEDGHYFNQLVFVYPNGDLKTYKKRHTFTLAGEHKVYTAGTERTIVDYKGWKLFPLVCYDLRFPVWSRYNNDYDVLFYVANWPVPRTSAWDALLKARAIENMCYCVGVNRVGEDEKGHMYSGHSAVYNALGDTVSEFNENEIGYRIVVLKKEDVVNTRRKFKFLNDRDAFTLE